MKTLNVIWLAVATHLHLIVISCTKWKCVFPNVQNPLRSYVTNLLVSQDQDLLYSCLVPLVVQEIAQFTFTGSFHFFYYNLRENLSFRWSHWIWITIFSTRLIQFNTSLFKSIIYQINNLLNYHDVFISCLDSHSDGTHSLRCLISPNLFWWRSKLFYILDGVYFQQILFFGWTLC